MDTKPQPQPEPEPEAKSWPTTSLLVEMEQDPSPARTSLSCGAVVRNNLLLILTFTGALLGFAIGFGVRELRPSKDSLMWIGMPGELFLRVLNLMVTPLVAGSVISGTSSLDPRSNGRISVVALAWIVSTNILACLLGVLLSVTIRPGEGKGATDNSVVTSPFETQDIFADLLRNLVPDNLVELGFRKAVTQYSVVSQAVSYNLTNGTAVTVTVDTRTKAPGKADGTNVLGLICVCVVFGMAANRLGQKADLFVRFFTVLTDIVLMVLKWFFWMTPVGVASLIAQTVSGITDLHDSFSRLGYFVVVVVGGVLVFQLLVLSLLLLLLTGRNPVYFHWSILRPYVIGCATASSSLAFPEMLHCCEVKQRIDPRVTRFCLPFSITISANGSAYFIVCSAIFIAHYIGRDLSANDVIVITFLASVSAMALPSVPSSSLVTLVIILASLNIPSSNIALLFAVEWLLDRVRTACNIVSHCYCAAVTYRFCKAGLDSRDKDLNSRDTGLVSRDTRLASRDKDLDRRDSGTDV